MIVKLEEGGVVVFVKFNIDSVKKEEIKEVVLVVLGKVLDVKVLVLLELVVDVMIVIWYVVVGEVVFCD